MSVTPKLPLIYLFLFLSNIVTPPIHLNILISTIFIFIFSFSFSTHHSDPYIFAGLTYLSPLMVFFFITQRSYRFSSHDLATSNPTVYNPPLSYKIDPKYSNISTLLISRSPITPISLWHMPKPEFKKLRFSRTYTRFILIQHLSSTLNLPFNTFVFSSTKITSSANIIHQCTLFCTPIIEAHPLPAITMCTIFPLRFTFYRTF